MVEPTQPYKVRLGDETKKVLKVVVGRLLSSWEIMNY